MITHIAVRAASCTTGSWAQQWQCKWNQGWNSSTLASSHAGYSFGHNILPILILVAFVFLAAKGARRRKAARPAPAAKAWKTAKAPARR